MTANESSSSSDSADGIAEVVLEIVPPPFSGISNDRRLPHVPRLDITTFLAWTVTAAAAMLFINGLGTSARMMSAWQGAIAALGGAAAGWILTCTFLIARHRVTRTLWRLEPGEWLVLCGAVIVALVLANVLYLVGRTNVYSRFPWEQMLTYGALMTMYLIGAFCQRDRRRWCAAFISIAAAFGLMLLNSGLSMLFSMRFSRMILSWLPTHSRFQMITFFHRFLDWSFLALMFVAIVLVLLAAWRDWSKRTAWHWMHWSGVLLSALAYGGLEVMLLTYLVFRRF